MPTPVDDLKPGMWLAVVARKFDPPRRSWYAEPEPAVFDGSPAKILAISLPFLCAQCGDHRMSIDLRMYAVQKLNNEYVAAATGRPFQEIKTGRKKKPKPERDERDCPRCGARMHQSCVNSVWRYQCPECRFEPPTAVTA